MAPARKPSSSKQAQQLNTATPLNLSAPRRSSRVQKRSVDSGAPSSPEKLIEAARMLQGDVKKSNVSKSGKRVSFESQPTHPIQQNNPNHHHHQHDANHFLRQLRQGSWGFPMPTVNDLQSPSSTTVQPDTESVNFHVTKGPTGKNRLESRPSPRKGARKPSIHLSNDQGQGVATSAGAVPQPKLSSVSEDSSCIECPLRRQKVKDLFSKEVAANAEASRGTKRSLDNHHVNDFQPSAGFMKRRKGFVPELTRTKIGSPIEYMLSGLRENPHDLTISQISAMLLTIQRRILGPRPGFVGGFSHHYFDFTLTQAQRDAWPLHDLMTKFIPLYMTTRYIADGSQNGWRAFFTQSNSRRHLVSAILGEWFAQRIFKHTAFGFPKHLTDILEEKDREFLHYDAVVRSKERAKLMQVWYADITTLRHINDTTYAAADVLAEELLTVIHPLLPPPIFDPLDESTALPSSLAPNSNNQQDPDLLRNSEHRIELRGNIKRDLVSLILDCAALHRGIRLTGINGTIVRIGPNPEKDSPFHATAPMICVNGESPRQGYTSDPTKTQLLIKMTCFPRVEAVVPTGPDMLELEFLESQYRANLELESKVQSSTSKDTIPPKEFDWDEHEHHWPIVPPVLQDKEGRAAGDFNTETNRINTIKRASYVTVYQALCPAQVYCEWTPPPKPRRVPSIAQQVRSIPKSTAGLTLPEAVRHARLTHPNSINLSIETLKIGLWNHWAIYGGVMQWGVLGSAVVVGLCRYFRIPKRLHSLVVRAFRAVADSQTLKDVPAVVEGYAKQVYDCVGPFGPAVTGPVKELVVEPLKRGFELLKFKDEVGTGVGQPVQGVDVPVSMSLSELLTDDGAVPATTDSDRNGFVVFVASLIAGMAGEASASASSVIEVAAGGATPAASMPSEVPVRVDAMTSSVDAVLGDVTGAGRSRETTGRDAGEGEPETRPPVFAADRAVRDEDWILRLRRALIR